MQCSTPIKEAVVDDTEVHFVVEVMAGMSLKPLVSHLREEVEPLEVGGEVLLMVEVLGSNRNK